MSTPTPINILVVDDNDLLRLGIVSALKCTSGMNVAGEAKSGAEAIKLVQELKPDVILMDLAMPNIDGISATKSIRALTSSAKIIMLTSSDQENDVYTALSAGANGYCLKDVNVEILHEAIASVHSGAFWLHSGVAGKVVRLCSQATDALSLPLEKTIVTHPPQRSTGYISDKYEVLNKIGCGGMSDVFKCRHRLLDRIVAIKLLKGSAWLKSDVLERFIREARISSQLSHPNIINIYDFGLDVNGQPYLVMDYIAGPSLNELLNGKALMEPAALRLFLQLADGLAHAHSKQIIHRDLKPANILLSIGETGLWQARIVDFGLAQAVSHPNQRLTQEGLVLGSPPYMSPEQCLGGALDERSDIYSFGCLMYETLTGRPPFYGEGAMATMNMHLNSPAPAPAIENAALAELVRRCLSKNPAERFCSVVELKERLISIVQAEN